VTIAGADVAALEEPARFRREVVGFVFQLHHLIAGLTAEENVEVPLIPDVRRRTDRLARARAALAQVGLAERATHLPAELSGGERQRVALARAIVRHPRLLLADEPTGALDSAAGEEVLGLLGRLAREHGITVLLVSHDPGAERHVDRVIELLDGRIVRDAPLSRAPGPGAGA
jgi:putative ABC transport system ATP-binding protein